MIVKEDLIIDGKNFVKQYSDQNLYIQKVGTTEEYIEAVDLVGKGFEYIEIDKPIPVEESQTVKEDE